MDIGRIGCDVANRQTGAFPIRKRVRVPKITVLPEYARVLGVNLLWLIGFDDVSKFSDTKRDTVDITEYTPTKRAIIHSVGKLTEEDAEAIDKLLGRLNDDGGNQ